MLRIIEIKVALCHCYFYVIILSKVAHGVKLLETSAAR